MFEKPDEGSALNGKEGTRLRNHNRQKVDQWHIRPDDRHTTDAREQTNGKLWQVA